MLRALYTAASGMNAQETNLENIANDLSNSSTTGFRRRRVEFQDLLYQNMVVPGSASTQQTNVPEGLQIGLGVRSGSSEIIQQQGNATSTGNSLDLMIQGNGFFQVKLPSGEIAYTRAGNFHLDQNGNVVTSDGNPLDPPVTLPSNALTVSIGSDGTVTVTEPNQQQAAQVGSIQLALFPNPGGLNSIGDNLMLQTTASGQPQVGTPGGAVGLGSLQQGMLESSNVDVVQEMVDMILTQRNYEANSNVVQTANQMFQTLNQLGR
ncbi:MAG: flagellar basal-body rod protein FlgG [Terriglobia bacterium]